MLHCEICTITFSSKACLKRHLKNIHKHDGIIETPHQFNLFNNKCLELGCARSYRHTSELRCHLEKYHGIQMEKEILNFSSEQEFQLWLDNLVNKDNVNYTQHHLKKRGTTYFTCNRSGKFVSKTVQRKRAMKSQGTCKIGCKCTSEIILKKHSDNNFSVTYHKSHYGHSIEIQHVRISKHQRTDVATKLTSGISATRILDTYRNNITKSKFSRCDIITRKDINNIKVSYNIGIHDGVRHENDSLSVDLWVKQSNETSCDILLYKKQGQEFPRLRAEDFCLIFMNKVQETLLKDFGLNIIAIDSTHGLNLYDFELTTVMVIDEYGEGFPGACMFSNRKDTLIQEIFFECIKMRVGVICPKVFMSDITNVFFNAWLNVMGGGIQNRLLCSWHIDRAWRNNLNKIHPVEKRKEVYQMLKVLQNTLSIPEFESKLASALKYLLDSSHTKTFGIYFKENYTNNCNMWAYCYRQKCGINTNMVLESMHKTVKYFYLDGKVVKRLDKGITALQKYIRDKTILRIIKLVKGVNNSHIKNIHKRHKTALGCTFEIIDNKSNSWTLKSENNDYFIKKSDTPCAIENCQLRCSYCNICIHEYECTCSDFYITTTLCKHIHYIHLNAGSPNETIEVPQTAGTSNFNALSTLAENTVEEACNIKNKIQEIANHISSDVESCDNPDILSHILKTFKNAQNLLQIEVKESIINAPESTSDIAHPSNKKIKKQASFYSTKKKTKNLTKYISKPSRKEIASIGQTLSIYHDHGYC